MKKIIEEREPVRSWKGSQMFLIWSNRFPLPVQLVASHKQHLRFSNPNSRVFQSYRKWS